MFCKVCGSELEDGSFFCPACGAYIRSRQDDASEIRKMKEVAKGEVTQPALSHSPSKSLSTTIHHHSQVANYFPMVFGLMILTFAIAIMFPEEVNYILPSGCILIGLAFLYFHYHQSPHGIENRLLYFAIATFIMTFGFVIMFADEANYIIPAGFMLTALLFTGHFARRSRQNRGIYGVLVVVILTIGSAMMFPNVVDYIFPAGAIIIALLIITWSFHRSVPRSHNKNHRSFQH